MLGIWRWQSLGKRAGLSLAVGEHFAPARTSH
jgi:hypothetical protein